MFCAKCGTELPDNAKFCVKCGNQINRVKDDETVHQDNNFEVLKETSKSKLKMSVIVSIFVGIVILMAVIGTSVMRNNKVESKEEVIRYSMQDDIRLLGVTGNVVVLDYEGNEIEIVNNMRLLPGYTVETGEDSNVWIQINEGTVSALSENGQLSLSNEDLYVLIVETGTFEEVSPEMMPSLIALMGDMQVGKTISFGQYEQDNNLENGKEPIEWVVVA